MTIRSAGILRYRIFGGVLEVMLAHPGGPLWEGRDAGAWTIPKGLVDDDESLLDAARREFEEETGFAVSGDLLPLGEVRLRSGKIVHAWASEGDLDADGIVSNLFEMEWPRGSGKLREFPEIDRAEWYRLDHARTRIFESQLPFLDRLHAAVSGGRT